MRAVWVVEIGTPWMPWTLHTNKADALRCKPPDGIASKWRVTKYVPAPAKKPAKGGPRAR